VACRSGLQQPPFIAACLCCGRAGIRRGFGPTRDRPAWDTGNDAATVGRRIARRPTGRPARAGAAAGGRPRGRPGHAARRVLGPDCAAQDTRRQRGDPALHLVRGGTPHEGRPGHVLAEEVDPPRVLDDSRSCSRGQDQGHQHHRILVCWVCEALAGGPPVPRRFRRANLDAPRPARRRRRCKSCSCSYSLPSAS